jgi:hypothetical protein
MDMDKAGCEKLAEAWRISPPTALSSLNISANNLEDDGAVPIFKALLACGAKLQWLDVSDNRMRAKVCNRCNRCNRMSPL